MSKDLKKCNAACFYMPIVLKLIISVSVQMWKQHNFNTLFVKIYQVLINLNWIDNTDWLNIMVDDLNYLSRHVLIFLT